MVSGTFKLSWIQILGILATITCLASAQTDQNQCPDKNSKYYNGYCYITIYSYDRLSWHKAEERCQSIKAHLASIHSENEIEFIKKYMDSLYFSSNDIWIGLHSFGFDDQLRWVDGSVLSYTKINFGEKEEHEREECFVLNRMTGEWTDEPCGIQKPFLCKRSLNEPTIPPPSPTPSIPGNCPPKWKAFGNKCFRVMGTESDSALTWEEAKTACKKMGKKHNLASIHSTEEQVFMTSLVGMYNSSLWVGLSESNQIYAFMWADNSNMDFTNWGPNEPLHHAFSKTCGALSKDKVLTGRWHTVKCETRLGYVCQRYKDPSLPSPPPESSNCSKHAWDFVNYRSACYHLFLASDLKMTWEKAESFCGNYKGHLVSIADGGEAAFIRNYLRENPTESAWIGMKKRKDRDTFEWSDGWPVYFTHWGKDEPIEIEDEDNCVTINEQGEWIIEECTEKKPFICKITEEIPPIVPSEFEESKGSCPTADDHWIDLGGRYCYLLNASLSFNFDDALHYCSRHRAVLASFHSRHELDLLAPAMKNLVKDVWIGLVQKSDRSYGWYDHSPLIFTNWVDNKEPISSSAKRCIVMSLHERTWKAVSCGTFERYGLICKAEKRFDQVPTSEEVTDRACGLTVGVTVAIAACCAVVGISSALVGIAIYQKVRRKPGPSFPRGFDNQNYDPFVAASSSIITMNR